MPLNKAKGNMYDFVTHTWNTVKGICPHGCSYCYCKRWGKQRELHFDSKELKTDLGKGNFIFVGSSCDMFADEIPQDWIDYTVSHSDEYENKYLYQTKNPSRIVSMVSPLSYGFDAVICTTIETNRFYPEIMRNSPRSDERAEAMKELINFERYVTIEPIMDFDLAPMVELIKRCEPVQVNIGADSGNNHLPEPSSLAIGSLIEELEKFTKVKLKPNLKRIYNEL